MTIQYIETPQAVELSKQLRTWTGRFKGDGDGYSYPKILWIGEHLFLVKTAGYSYESEWHSPQVQLRRADSPKDNSLGTRGAGDGYAHGWSGRDYDVVMVIKRSPGSSPSYRDYVGRDFDGPCGPLTSDVLFDLIELARDADRRWEAEEAQALEERLAKREAQERGAQAQDALKAAREEVWIAKDVVVAVAAVWAKDEGCDPATIVTNASALLGAVARYEAALAVLTKLEGE